MSYTLEVYLPGSREPWVSYDSDLPFGAISVGDLLTPLDAEDQPMTMRVTSVEHAVWYPTGRPVRHKIMVYGDLASAAGK